MPKADSAARRFRHANAAESQEGDAAERIEGYIMDAQANGGGWVQLVFHHVCVKCDAYQITPTHLSS